MTGLARALTALIAGLAFPAAAAAAQDTWTATDAATAPTARYLHSAVWTGSEMIVWGGTDPFPTATGTGSRYNPVANSWNPTSMAAAPTPRFAHTAVWTGSRMIVWGGDTGPSRTNTGGSYDPASNTWIPISTVGAPAARSSHVAVWTGREMLVWGGQDNVVYLDSGGRYDPLTDTWTPMTLAGAPSARYLTGSAVWTGRELIIWGGVDPVTTAELSTGGRYDPELDQWAAVSTVGSPQPRASHSAVWTGREMIVFGGITAASGGSGDSYDPVSNSWTPLPTADAPVPRSQAAAVWTGRGMLVFGGSATGSGAVLNSGAIYDPALRTWTAISTVGAPSVTFHPAVWTGREMIVWGGIPPSSGTAVNTGARYLPVADPRDNWSALPTTGAPSPRAYASGEWSGRELLVWGANLGFGATGGEKYDPRTETWTAISSGSAPSARVLQTSVWTGKDLIVWGGDDGGPGTSSGGRYAPHTNTWTATSLTGAPSPRYLHTAVWTGREMLVWGGIDKATTFSTNTGARYDPKSNTWTTMTLVNAPAARHRQVAVWTGRVLIVWGGESYLGGPTTFFNNGASYNPATDTWTPLTATGAPEARTNFPAVWTGDRMIVWGGTGNNGRLDNGAAYFPASDSWSALPVSPLAARESPSMVWTGGEMIVWGGATPTFENTGARYSPVSNSWTSTTLAGAPIGRQLHVQVWTGSRMLIWGGQIATGMTDTGGAYGGDDSLPTAGGVNDGLIGDLVVQIDTSSLSANWSGFLDAESGIAHYEWALGTSPGATDLQAFVDVGTATSATASGLSLAVGTTCYATVRAVNGDGRVVTSTSNGVYIGADLSADTGCGGSVPAPVGVPFVALAVVLLLLAIRKERA